MFLILKYQTVLAYYISNIRKKRKEKKGMKRKSKKVLLAAAGIAALTSIPAYAGSNRITSVGISVEEDKPSPGVVYPVEVKCNSTEYEIESISATKDYSDWKPGRKVTYDITVVPTDGNFFSKSETKVQCSGNASIPKATSISRNEIRLKLNYVPKVQLEAPENIYFEDEYEATWDEVEYATGYELKLYKDGEYYKTIETSNEKIDLSDYVTDSDDITFDIRAAGIEDGESKYLLPSEWVNCDESVSAADNTVYGSFAGNYENYYFKDDNGNPASGWQHINGHWYYFDPADGNRAARSGWRQVNQKWYFFSDTCTMMTGWVHVNGQWYYLNQDGSMKTGWHASGPSGKWYYLDPVSGAMWANAVTPDGYAVDAEGAWIQ